MSLHWSFHPKGLWYCVIKHPLHLKTPLEDKWILAEGGTEARTCYQTGAVSQWQREELFSWGPTSPLVFQPPEFVRKLWTSCIYTSQSHKHYFLTGQLINKKGFLHIIGTTWDFCFSQIKGGESDWAKQEKIGKRANWKLPTKNAQAARLRVWNELTISHVIQAIKEMNKIQFVT